MKRCIRLYKVLVAQFLKTIMQSRLDFLVGLIGFFLVQISGVVFLYLIFRQIPNLQGWSFDQLVFIYGFAQIPRGIDHLFTDNIWKVAWFKIVEGEFDRYMLRPMNLLFQIISEELQPDALGELLVGLILVISSLSKGIVVVDGVHILLFMVSIIAGALIYTSIKLFFATIAFWIKISGPFVYLAYQMSDFAKYPIEIYAKVIRFVITWIIPFAFVAYLPASYFLGVGNILFKEASAMIIGIEVLIAVVFCIIAYSFFLIGTKCYESSGN